ncbi:MAG: HEAT repeat domain-containing protein [Terriglobales bacterium]
MSKFDAVQAQLQKLDSTQTAKELDAAMYWQAYAASKLGRLNDAMNSLATLNAQFPDSAWKEDAAALKLQLQQISGQNVSPAAQGNDDLKLLAINGLMQSDPAQALPLLEKVARGTSSPAVKSRALFVMAQNHSPAAIADITEIAESSTDPGLSLQAVRYLGIEGGDTGRAALADIYAKSASNDVRSGILRAYMMGGDKARLLAAAKSESNPDLQQQAVRELGLAGGKEELWQVYQSNPPAAVKASIIRSLGMTGDLDHLIPLAKGEKDPSLRADAIHSLGLSRSSQAQDALAAMYSGAQDKANSEAIIQALFLQRGTAALVALARKETDPELKRDLVQRLSLMHDKAATAYLMELLNQ